MLHRINPVTAATTRIGLFGFNAPEGDLAIHPGTGVLFDTSSTTDDSLITIDPATGTATIIGRSAPPGATRRDWRSAATTRSLALRFGMGRRTN